MKNNDLNGEQPPDGKLAYGVAPPSVCPGKGEYRFIEGGLGDIERLPVIRIGSLPVEAQPVSRSDRVGIGSRTKKLFHELRKIAFQCETIEELALKGAGINEAIMEPPLSEADLQYQVRGVWKLKEEGRLIVPGSGKVVFGQEEGAKLYEYPPAMTLLHYLKSNHGPEHEFAISPLGLVKVLPCSHPTIAKARDYLVDIGFLEQTHVGGCDGNPHRFKFSKASALKRGRK